MADELENISQPEPESTTGDLAENHAATPEELEAIRTQLAEEQATTAEAQALLTERDERIAELEASLAQAQGIATEVESLRQAHSEAVSHYLGAQRALNPHLPEGVIRGESIKDIDDSVSEATSIAQAVRATVEAEVKNSRVPAGAPTRSVDMEALSPADKIRVGLSQEKGGTS